MTNKKEFKGYIAIVDDDTEVRLMLEDHLLAEGYSVESFEDGAKALDFLLSSDLKAQNIELVISDLRMPEVDGLSLLEKYKSHCSAVPVMIMTAHATLETAIEGLRKGAFDYLLKPFKLSEMTLAVNRAIQFSRLQRQNKTLVQEVKKNWLYKEIIGKSNAMKELFGVLEKVSQVHSSVLIQGESGTGKELVARAIHNNSPRANGPFVAINCSAIPDTLLESELFGYVKGAFTGANQDKKGLFEKANEGTIFLDEIGDMSLSLQAKLLRVLQDKEIRPIGSNVSKAVNVRVIAASHKDLKKAIQEENFREDLYFRLAIIPIMVPPLRQRLEDIPLLAQHFLLKYTSIHNSRILGFSEEAMKRLMGMEWVGNVRELESLIERIVVLTSNPIIAASDIPEVSTQYDSFYAKNTQDHPTLEELERRYIQYILAKTGGKKEKTAQMLGINRRTLYRKEKEFGFSNAENCDLDSELES